MSDILHLLPIATLDPAAPEPLRQNALFMAMARGNPVVHAVATRGVLDAATAAAKAETAAKAANTTLTAENATLKADLAEAHAYIVELKQGLGETGNGAAQPPAPPAPPARTDPIAQRVTALRQAEEALKAIAPLIVAQLKARNVAEAAGVDAADAAQSAAWLTAQGDKLAQHLAALAPAPAPAAPAAQPGGKPNP